MAGFSFAPKKIKQPVTVVEWEGSNANSIGEGDLNSGSFKKGIYTITPVDVSGDKYSIIIVDVNEDTIAMCETAIALGEDVHYFIRYSGSFKSISYNYTGVKGGSGFSFDKLEYTPFS
jgi:hypothetical protein